MPDLEIDVARLGRTVRFEDAFFPRESCEVAERCVAEYGWRRLLRFDTTSVNVGHADLEIGVPDGPWPDGGSPFVYDPCHMHHHLARFATYELLDRDGQAVGAGRKLSSCIGDDELISSAPGVRRLPAYNCNHQGLSIGWAETYLAALPCQWIDVTGVPEGDYTLRVEVNEARVLAEERTDNNVGTAVVHVPPPGTPLDAGADTRD